MPKFSGVTQLQVHLITRNHFNIKEYKHHGVGATLANLPVPCSTPLAAQERLALSPAGHLYPFHEPVTQQLRFLPNLNSMLLLLWNAKWENAGNAEVNRSADTTLITAAQTHLCNCS